MVFVLRFGGFQAALEVWMGCERTAGTLFGFRASASGVFVWEFSALSMHCVRDTF